jgi:hypothetical protein
MSTPGISKASVTTSEDAVDRIHTSASEDPIFPPGSRRQSALPRPDPERLAVLDENEDVFGNEEGAEIHYKTCSWW